MRKKWVWKTRAARSIALATAAMLVTTNATVPTFAAEVSTVQGENTKTDFSDGEDNKTEASVNEDKTGADSKADETDNAFTDDEAGTTDGSDNAGEESTDNSSGGGDETNEADASEDKDKTDEKETDDDSDKDATDEKEIDDDSDKDATDEKETDDDSDEDEADDDDESDSDLIDDSESDETDDEKEENKEDKADEEDTDEDMFDEALEEEPELPELPTEDVVTEDASTFAGKDFKAAKTEFLDEEAEAPTSGKCGENVSWEYDTETKTLTISGNGAMYDEEDLEADDFDFSGLWYAWYGEDGIETVEIKDGVTTIMPCAFLDCRSVTKVTIGNSVKSIGYYAFSGCSISELVIGNSVESIGNLAFEGGIFGDEESASIKLPDSLIDIGIESFAGNDLGKVIFGKKVKTIGFGAFSDNLSLISVIIPDSVTSIGAEAFARCSLEWAVIGTGVKTIGGMAFADCSELKEVTLKGNVKTIGQGAFSYCDSLEFVAVKGAKPAKLLNYFTYELFVPGDGEMQYNHEQMEDEDENIIETDFVFGEAKFVTEGDKGITVPNGTLAAYQNAWSDWADYMEEADDPTTNITIGADGDEEERDNYLQGNSIERLMDSVLTDEDIEKLEQGQTVNIWLEIENEADSVSEADKEAIQGKLGDYKEGVYLNIQLKKQFSDDDDATNVTDPHGTIQISYTVPEELRNTDASVKREYMIIYIHDGQVKELECSFDEKTGTVTFDTKEFSTYSLVYKDTKLVSNSGGSGSGGSDSDDDSSSAGASYGSMPSYVEVGSWNVLADGTWSFTGRNGKSYQNEWAAIYNPYAPKGQMSYDWFRFDENKRMITGWFTDPTDGKIYYLNPISDGTLGRMCMGWQWIDRDGDGVFECYYFNPTSDGTRGSLFSNTTTPDGYQVNENGQWIADGVVQTK